jgi:outer membrane protein assembly factor BamB
MQFTGWVYDEHGQPVWNAQVALSKEIPFDWQDSAGFVSLTDTKGHFSVYMPDDLTGYELNIRHPTGRSASSYYPAVDYNNAIVELDTPGRSFPWWIIIVAGVGAWYTLRKPTRKTNKRKA